MEPTDRIKIIVEISNRLGAEGWGIIDLTLRQFGLPTSESWSGESVDYVAANIEGADPEVLTSLGRHVGLSEGDNQLFIIPDFWRDGYLRLFITHLATHKKFAAMLQSVLVSYGISSFVAHNDIEPSREWVDEIELALGTCDAALAVMHPEFHDSFWVDQELGYVMGRGVPVLTARLGQDPYGFLSHVQSLKTREENSDVLAEEIFNVLVSHKSTNARMTSALVTRLEHSNSFDDAKLNMGRLENVVYWNSSMSDRCRNAVAANSQVKDSFGVPRKIESLIYRFENPKAK